MLPKEKLSTQTHKLKNNLITVFQSKSFTQDANYKNGNREYLVSWLFLIGSLMFLLDSFLEVIEGISIHVVIHIVSSILFTIGSLLFIPINKK